MSRPTVFSIIHRLTFDQHVSAMAWLIMQLPKSTMRVLSATSRHLISTSLAQTLACSSILSRIDYCYAAPACSIQNWNVFTALPPGSFCRLQTITASAPLAAGSIADHIQVTEVSRADVQDPPHSNTCLPQLSHAEHVHCLWPHSALLYSSAAVSTVP